MNVTTAHCHIVISPGIPSLHFTAENLLEIQIESYFPSHFIIKLEGVRAYLHNPVEKKTH